MKSIKKIIAVLISLSLVSLTSFAAVVSDNDGAAFITKAEFDSLKNTFQSQLNGFNSNIDNKIDSAISSYLAGVKQEKTSKLNTAFVLDGADSNDDKNNEIIFVGKTNNFNNMTNELYADDRIFEIIAGTYKTTAYYMQDTYDTFCFQAYYTKGNDSNYLMVLDKDKGTVKSTKKNVKMNSSRIYAAYSTTHAQNGIFWNSITQTLNTPDAITNQDNAYIASTTAMGYGVNRRNVADGPNPPYINLLNEKLYVTSGQRKGMGKDSSGQFIYQNLYATDLEEKVLSDVTKTCDVAITGTDVSPNLHWPTGSNNNIHTTDKEWGSKDLITSYNTSRVDYTYVYKLKNAGGPVGLMELAIKFDPDVKGYGVKWVSSDKALTGVYYDGMYDNWNIKYSYAGGLPICHANKKSLVKISLKCDTTVPMAFTTSQNTTFPTGSDSRFKKFRSKQSTAATFVERTAPVNFTANVDYDFEIDLNAGEDLFLTTNMTTLSNTLTITQLGDAFITEEG